MWTRNRDLGDIMMTVDAPGIACSPYDTRTYRALSIFEIFTRICEFADQRTLAVLARTCKYFLGPATQELWRVLPNLAPLVRLFPRDSWKIEGKAVVSALL